MSILNKPSKVAPDSFHGPWLNFLSSERINGELTWQVSALVVTLTNVAPVVTLNGVPATTQVIYQYQGVGIQLAKFWRADFATGRSLLNLSLNFSF